MQPLEWRHQLANNELRFWQQEAQTASHQRTDDFRGEAQRYEATAHETSEHRLRAAAQQFGSDKRSQLHT